MNPPNANVRTLAVGIALSLVLILAISVLSVDQASDLAARPSTFFTDDTGTRAIYLILQTLLPDVRQWRRPLSELPIDGPAEGSTLIVMGPVTPLGRTEAEALDGWIRSGGQIILATASPWTIDAPGGDEEQAASEEERPEEDFLSRHGIETVAEERNTTLDDAVTVNLGSGRIVYVPDAGAFSNESVADPERSVWIATRAGDWGPTTLFDEYHLGFGQPRDFRTLIGAFMISPWGLACLQLVLAGLVYLVGTKRRFGRPIAPLAAERTSSLEAVDALGGLFEAAGAVELSARSIHAHINHELSSMMGRPVDWLDPHGRALVSERTGIARSELDSGARQARDLMKGARNSNDELLQIGRLAARITGDLGHGAHRNRIAITPR